MRTKFHLISFLKEKKKFRAIFPRRHTDFSPFSFVKKPNSVHNRPYPANDQESKQELKNPKKQGSAVEIIASAGRNHCTDSRSEGDAIQDEAHNGKSVIKGHDRLLTSSTSFVDSFFHHSLLDSKCSTNLL